MFALRLHSQPRERPARASKRPFEALPLRLGQAIRDPLGGSRALDRRINPAGHGQGRTQPLETLHLVGPHVRGERQPARLAARIDGPRIAARARHHPDRPASGGRLLSRDFRTTLESAGPQRSSPSS
jgi:hypothetical protein